MRLDPRRSVRGKPTHPKLFEEGQRRELFYRDPGDLVVGNVERGEVHLWEKQCAGQ